MISKKKMMVAGALLFLCATITVSAFFIIHHKTMPKWARVTSADPASRNAEFESNVKRYFPVGMEYPVVMEQLHHARFNGMYSEPGQKEICQIRLDVDFPCQETRTICWMADETNITSLRGKYQTTCY